MTRHLTTLMKAGWLMTLWVGFPACSLQYAYERERWTSIWLGVGTLALSLGAVALTHARRDRPDGLVVSIVVATLAGAVAGGGVGLLIAMSHGINGMGIAAFLYVPAGILIGPVVLGVAGGIIAIRPGTRRTAVAAGSVALASAVTLAILWITRR